ncbi:hypothetical protein SAMN02745866_01920 [Alteromonadaceae bacterium Bs31]|nr:hypothetical protein SAMN02745866_01920 [Alteromonadaceae bacterium Bs31]
MNETEGSEELLDTSVLGSSSLVDGELVLATLVGIDEEGHPKVSFELAGNFHQSLVATSTVSVLPKHVGRQAALLFLNKDIERPVVVGFIHNPLYTILDPSETVATETPEPSEQLSVEVDKKVGKFTLEGEEEVVIRCGEASITLSKSGKIQLRGKYLVSRSSGVNRILGGSVQVN